MPAERPNPKAKPKEGVVRKIETSHSTGREVYDHIRGPLKAANYELAALKGMATYGIPDMVAATGITTADALADQIDGMNPQRLHRAMRFLSAVGYFTLNPETRAFALTERGEQLRQTHPSGAHSELVSIGSDEVAGLLPDILKTHGSDSAFSQKTGSPHWEFLKSDPEQSALFDRKMEAILQGILPFITDDVEWSQWQHIVDIGGGNGTLMKALKRKYPALSLAQFDLPTVINPIKDDLSNRGIGAISGDFLIPQQVPAFPENTCLVLSRVLHDWSDKDATVILKNLRDKSPSDNTLRIIEMAIDESNLSPAVATRDITMMLLYGDAKERTMNEFNDILNASGWHIRNVIPGPNDHVVIEAATYMTLPRY